MESKVIKLKCGKDIIIHYDCINNNCIRKSVNNSKLIINDIIGIYMLKQYNKVYIGITNNLSIRINQHINNIVNDNMRMKYTNKHYKIYEQMFNKDDDIDIYILETFNNYDSEYMRYREYLYSQVYLLEGYEVMNNYSISNENIIKVDKIKIG